MPIYIGNNLVNKLIVGIEVNDADTYISAINNAGGSLSGAEETAIQTFFTTLKSDGVYDKLHAMYPFVGGVANAHKINAKNPGTYDLTFNGTWTHSNASGSVTTDANGNYADTGLDPSTLNSTTDFSVGQMIADAASGNGYSGIGDAAAKYILLGQANLQLDTHNGGSPALAGNPGYTGGAFHANSRTGASAWSRHYALSGSSTTLTSNSYTDSLTSYSANMYINDINGAANNTLSGDYRFFFMGEGLSTSNVQDLADAVNTLNVAFSRNIFTT